MGKLKAVWSSSGSSSSSGSWCYTKPHKDENGDVVDPSNWREIFGGPTNLGENIWDANYNCLMHDHCSPLFECLGGGRRLEKISKEDDVEENGRRLEEISKEGKADWSRGNNKLKGNLAHRRRR